MLLHDLAGLLTVVQMEVEEPEPDPEGWSQIQEASRTMGELVRTLRAVERQSPARDIDLSRWMQAHRRLLDRASGGRLRLDLQPGEGAARVAEPTLLRVALNLIVNARHALEEAGKHGVIEVAVWTMGRQVVLEVSDDGPGICPLLASRVFEPGFTTRASRGGTGLGLPSVRREVEEAGGSVRLATGLGQGTRVRVLLPRVD